MRSCSARCALRPTSIASVSMLYRCMPAVWGIGTQSKSSPACSPQASQLAARPVAHDQHAGRAGLQAPGRRRPRLLGGGLVVEVAQPAQALQRGDDAGVLPRRPALRRRELRVQRRARPRTAAPSRTRWRSARARRSTRAASPGARASPWRRPRCRPTCAAAPAAAVPTRGGCTSSVLMRCTPSGAAMIRPPRLTVCSTTGNIAWRQWPRCATSSSGSTRPSPAQSVSVRPITCATSGASPASTRPVSTLMAAPPPPPGIASSCHSTPWLASCCTRRSAAWRSLSDVHQCRTFKGCACALGFMQARDTAPSISAAHARAGRRTAVESLRFAMFCKPGSVVRMGPAGACERGT